MYELLIRINDILENAMSKCVGNTAYILAYLISSASRQHHDIWSSQFPCLHNLKDTVLPSEAFLYGCLNLSLAQPWQQCSIGLSQSFISMRGGKVRPKLGSTLMFKSSQCHILVLDPLQRSLTLKLELSHQDSRNSSGCASGSPTSCRKNGTCGEWWCSKQLSP